MGAALGSIMQGKGPGQDVVVDFQGAGRNEASVASGDRGVFQELTRVLSNAKEALQQLRSYQDCAPMIRKAISTPSDQALQERAFSELFPNVNYIQRVHVLAEDLAQVLKQACGNLAAGGDDAFGSKPALLTRVADLLHFALEYDTLKMTTPAIQNDFAFYKRSLSKFGTRDNLPLSENEASIISMFVANANPITKSLKPVLRDDAAVRRTLLLLANCCCGMIHERHVEGADAEWTGKVMTEAVVIYDELGFPGAFVKKSDLAIRPIIRSLDRLGPKEANMLRAQLRYSTETYSSGHPSNKRLLED